MLKVSSPQFGPSPVAFSSLSPIEQVSSDAKKIISTYLSKADLIALGRASKSMRKFIHMLKRDEEILSVQVNAVLKKPYAERKLEDLVRIGLLPRRALSYPFTARQVAVLLTTNIIKGLELNKKNGVYADIVRYAQAQDERLPQVVQGIAMLRDAFLDMASLSHKDDTFVTLSAIVQSNIFANALCEQNLSLFEACLGNFQFFWGAQCADSLDGDHLDLLKHWTHVVHPDIYQIREPIPLCASAGKLPESAGFSSRFEAMLSHQDIVAVMLTQHVNFDIEKADGKSPLIYATSEQRPQTYAIMSTLLASRHIDINHADKLGRTALHWAAVTGQLDKLELLVSHGADVKRVDEKCRNALHCLFAEGKWKGKTPEQLERAIKCLLYAGVPLLGKDSDKKRPIDYIREAEAQGGLPEGIAGTVKNAMREHKKAGRDGCSIA
jgi:hypothetical protein